MSKLPSFQFYPGDWRKDPNLRRCSHEARGVWMDILCLMFDCDERGVLITGSSPWSREDVAAAVGGNADVTLRCIDELVAKGVMKVRVDGAFWSKRMVEDEENRKNTRIRVEKHRFKNEKQNCNASSNADVTALSHPSSSSSSSSDISTHTPQEKSTKARFQKPTLEELKAYFREIRGTEFDAEAFFDFHESKGWVIGRSPMKDWKSASRNWMRNAGKFSSRQVPQSRELDLDEMTKQSFG